MLIGVIADTHGLLRPQVFDVFSGVDRILHAGDIGRDEGILTELGALAPVDAVYGNTDGFPLSERLPEWQILTFGRVRVFLTHICGGPARFRLDWPGIGEIEAAVFGHSHKPLVQRENGILFLNPGSAGPKRFSLPISVGLLRIEGSRVDGEIVPLAG